ncbi:MAG TPA: GGDEF domain-containing protein [Burkholderiaceae bacterium]|nr:GGDEF domain-containing protein [Burkholderiaceae bacterium]
MKHDHPRETGRLWVPQGPEDSPTTQSLKDCLLRCELLQAQVLTAQAALAAVHQELEGTRAGERRAHHLAMHDGLTHLPNQRHFMARLTQVLSAWDAPSPKDTSDIPAPCVVFLDLDGFKNVNDQHGHAAGDSLLKAVASRLLAAVRAGDVVARVGGDEFACLLEGTQTDQQLALLAHKIHDKLASPVTLPLTGGGWVKLRVAPSIGLARCPQDGTSPTALLAAADRAMYQAKRERSQVAFASALRD